MRSRVHKVGRNKGRLVRNAAGTVRILAGPSSHQEFHMRFLPVSIALAAAFFAALPLRAAARTADAVVAAPALPAYQARKGRTRPLVAVLGDNAGTELTDFVLPYAILSRADVADVKTVALRAGPLRMRPALTLQAETHLVQFDAEHPEGADYVIVAAMTELDNPQMQAWLRSQAAKGATLVSICDGAIVLGKAGLLKGRRATAHWASYGMRANAFADTRWVKNVRYVADGNVISSAGISASIPVSLALVEAIGGRARAERVAAEIGQADWSTRHDSERYRVVGLYATGIVNRYFASEETVGLAVENGVDEMGLALAADRYSRTYRSKAYAVAPAAGPIRTRSGLTLLPDRVAGKGAAVDRMAPSIAGVPAALALDKVLADLDGRYGHRTAVIVADQLEYAWPAR
jgi:putative intracellular protease/amidase